MFSSTQPCTHLIGTLLCLLGACVLGEWFALRGERSTSEVLLNDCNETYNWNITLYPDPSRMLKGKPYTQYYRGQPECEPFSTDYDGEGNPIYHFHFDPFAYNCGIEDIAGNGTFEVMIVLPFRRDGVEVREDHLMLIQCSGSIPVTFRNQTVGGMDPRYTDYNPNKTEVMIYRPPEVRVTVLRDGVPLPPGAATYLGETLTMRIEVIDPDNVFTKVKVQNMWATYDSQPVADTTQELVSDGCSSENMPVESGIPIFENFQPVQEETQNVIENDFRVFRFAGKQNVFMWMTTTSCTWADETMCNMGIDQITLEACPEAPTTIAETTTLPTTTTTTTTTSPPVVEGGEEILSIEVYACASGYLDLVCSSGRTVKLRHIFWGWPTTSEAEQCGSDSQCTYWSKISDEYMDPLRERCDLKASCRIQADPTDLGDPCSGHLKMVKLKYSCMPKPEESGSGTGQWQEVIENNCSNSTTWNITIYPNPQQGLKGWPFTTDEFGEPGCNFTSMWNDTYGNPIYHFEFDLDNWNIRTHCGLEDFGNNGTYKIVVKIPFREDLYNDTRDHYVHVQCDGLLFNLSSPLPSSSPPTSPSPYSPPPPTLGPKEEELRPNETVIEPFFKRKRRASDPFSFSQWDESPGKHSPVSYYVHQVSMGTIQLVPIGRQKRETRDSKTYENIKEVEAVASMNSYHLVVYSAEELANVGRIETKAEETEKRVEKPKKETLNVCIPKAAASGLGAVLLAPIGIFGAIAGCFSYKIIQQKKKRKQIYKKQVSLFKGKHPTRNTTRAYASCAGSFLSDKISFGQDNQVAFDHTTACVSSVRSSRSLRARLDGK